MRSYSKSLFIVRCSLLICQLFVSDSLKIKPIHALQPNHFFARAQKGQQSWRLLRPHVDTSLEASPELLAADLWTSYNNALVASPLITKSVTAGVILGCADLAGQVIQNNANISNDSSSSGSEMQKHEAFQVDWSRAGRFALFGFILQAPWNHFYYLMLDGALPPTEDPFSSTTAIKVMIDQFIQAPIFTVVIFGFLGTLEGKSIVAIQGQLEEDYWNTMKANWKLWVPATMINIAFCPPILRVLFLNFVFFFWSIYLSLTLNKSNTK